MVKVAAMDVVYAECLELIFSFFSIHFINEPIATKNALEKDHNAPGSIATAIREIW